MADKILKSITFPNLPDRYIIPETVVDSVPTQGSTNAVSSGGVYSALAGKVAKPITSPNGTNGQLLRTLGNGQTEWTDFATPTTEQVGEAVEGWLDDHPEATTTVQDWSLTADKFVKGSLGYITPQMFGAKADGLTDDAPAIQSAINYAMANNCAVYFPSGTYAINPQSISIQFVGGDSLVMYGDGKTSCIKRMDESLTNRWDTLFVVNNADATADSGLMYIHDLYIDSNRRNQSNATDDFTYEASADFLIYFSNANGYSLDVAIFENLWFYDGVADHLDFTGTNIVHINTIVINKVFTSGRQGTRNDIDFPGIPQKNVFISNVVCERMHIEHNGTPIEPQYYFFTNIVCDEFTCPARLGKFKVVNLQVNKYMVFGCINGSARFINCEFNFRNTYSYIISSGGVSDIAFNNCVFNSYDPDTSTQPGNGDCTYLYLRRYLDIAFNNCTFNYVGEYDYTTKLLLPIATEYLSEGDTVNDQKITINGCSFSKKFSRAMRLYGCGTVVLKNMDIKTERLANINTNYGALDLTFININFSGVDCFYIETVSINTLEAHGEIICKEGTIKLNDGSSNQHTRITGDWKIIEFITAPLTKTLLDSILRTGTNYFKLFPALTFVYAGDNKELYPEKWECIANATVPNSQFNNERRFRSIGSGTGDTASRPACILSPGFEYYDTDIGKPIFWNGSGWVDSSGTTI